jgi:hypothetical protein
LRGELVIDNVVIFFCSNSVRASFAGVSCFQLVFLTPSLLVRWPVADICLYPWLIISVDFEFYRSSGT